MKKLKILGAILEKHNSPLKFKNLDVPKLNHGQLLIKMAYTGVCKSQLMEITGGRNNKIFIPHLLGHEGSGTVIDRHKSVTKLKLGDEVICSWLGTRGAKSDKIVYYDVNRKINAGPITTFSTYSIISEKKVLKKPSSLTLKEACLFGCCLPTGLGGAIKEKKINSNHLVLIIGLGGVGLCTLIGLLDKKIKNIIVIDTNSKKLKIAQELGIAKTYRFISKKKLLNDLANDNIHKFDYCFESAGLTKTIELGFELLKDKGRLIFSSHPHQKDFIRIKPHDLIKGKSIHGTWGGDIILEKDIRLLLKIYKRNKLKFKYFFENIYKFKDINKAINDLKNNKVNRSIIRF